MGHGSEGDWPNHRRNVSGPADRPRWIAVLTEEEFDDAPLSPSRFESFAVVGEPQPASYLPSS